MAQAKAGRRTQATPRLQFSTILLSTVEVSIKKASSSFAPQLSVSFAFQFLELPSSTAEHQPRKGQAMLWAGFLLHRAATERSHSSQSMVPMSRGTTRCTRRSSSSGRVGRSPRGAIWHAQPGHKQVMVLYQNLDQSNASSHPFKRKR